MDFRLFLWFVVFLELFDPCLELDVRYFKLKTFYLEKLEERF